MALETAGVSLVAAGGDVYISTMEKSTTATNTFVSATVQAGSKTSAAGQVMIGALREVGKIATQAFLEAGKAAIGFVKDSVSVAGDFEAGMHKFQAVAGDAVDTKGLDKFKNLFISLGKELPVSTSEVEQAAIEMVSGGIDPAIVQAGALRSTIQFAAASGLSLADAAATSAKFLAGWTSASASTADKVAFLTTSTDALTKAAAASSTTAAELRLGIFNVQGAAQALHAPFTDVVATLAELAPAFESSAQAGTALNVFMTRLEPQTDAAAGAMAQLGIITKTGQNLFFDAQGGFLGMGNAAQVLKEHLSGLSDEQKITTLHTLFGNDAMKVGNLLMQDGAAGIDAMKQKMDAANGVSATAALMQSGYNTALENAKGSVEALQITIGSALLPVLTDLLNNVIQPGINAVTDLSSAIMGDDEAFNKLTPTVQGIVTEVKHLTDAFNQGGISGLITALSDDITAAIPDIEAALQDWGKAFVEWIAPMIPPVLAELGKLIVAGAAWVVAQLPAWGKELLGWGKAFVEWIAPMIPPFLVELGKLVAAFGSWIVAQAAPLVTKFLAWKDAFIAWIGPAAVQFLAEWPKMFDNFLTWIGNEAGPLLKKLGDWALSFIQWIAPMIPPFLAELGKVALAIGIWVIETAAVLSNKIINTWLPAIVGWIITDAIPGLLKALNSFLKVIDDWIKDTERSVGEWMVAVGSSIVEGIRKGISDAWGSFTSWIHDQMMKIPKAVRDVLGISSPSTVFAEIGGWMVQGMMQGFTDAWPALTAQLSGLADGLADTMAKIGEQARNAIGDAFTATSTIDRQIASNLDAIQKIPEGFYRTATINALNNAQDIANKFADPAVGAKFFKMRSDQILEFQKLQQQINNEQDAATKARLIQQQTLILKAQEAEQAAFEAQNSRTAGPAQDIAKQINDIITKLSSVNLTQDQIRLVDMLTSWLTQLGGVPGRAGGGSVNANQPYWVGEDGPELFFPTMSGTVMPAATSMQLMGGGSTVNNNQSTSYSMPVYTNQSPAVLQQSFAVMRAGMI